MKGTLLFQFSDHRSAVNALDMLEELGYQPVMNSDQSPSLHVQIDQNDLTSALEIVQSYGGNLINEQTGNYEAAYQLEDAIPIPAHLVTEDLTEDYLQGDSFSADVRM